MPASFVANLFYEFALAGVNKSIPGNGGEECANFLPHWQKIVETAVFVPLSIWAIVWSRHKLEYPSPDQHPDQNGSIQETKKLLTHSLLHDHPPTNMPSLPLRNHVFYFYAGVFFIEVLYKTYTGTCIFFLNPCHVTSLLQLVLLKMPPKHPLTTQLFRFQLYTMPGAILAIAFPILNTRLLVGEVFIYFVQHLMIILVPLYLMSLEHGYVPESTTNKAWPIFSMSCILLYHYVFLQPIAHLTQVNLNVISCPSISDPFAGRLYRLAAICHQCLIVPMSAKLYGYSASFISLVIELCTQRPKVE